MAHSDLLVAAEGRVPAFGDVLVDRNLPGVELAGVLVRPAEVCSNDRRRESVLRVVCDGDRFRLVVTGIPTANNTVVVILYWPERNNLWWL